MKVVSALLVALVLFTVSAAAGSRALAADLTSPAFDHCLRTPNALGQCRPAGRILAAAEEFGAAAGDVYGGVDARDGGQDFSTPELWQEVLAAGLRALLVELARQVASALVGGAQAESDAEALARPELFDPAP